MGVRDDIESESEGETSDESISEPKGKGKANPKGKGKKDDSESEEEPEYQAEEIELEEVTSKVQKKKPPKKKSKFTVGCYESFKQQKLYSWQYIFTPLWMIIAFLILGLIFILIGILLVVTTSFVKQSMVYRYDNLCDIGSTCVFRFEIDDDMKKPIYLYYRLENFYQNHRRYVRSRSDNQLKGLTPNDYDALASTCYPVVSEGDSKSKDKVYLPCGLQAISFFNDTFTLERDDGSPISQKETKIAWASDREGVLYNDPGSGTEGIRIVASFENEHFLIWMRIAAIPSFLKLYAKIDENMDSGVYRIQVENNFPVHQFNGKKFFKLTTVEWSGGKNYFIGIAYLVCGVVLWILAFMFALKQIFNRRKMGDTAFLNWTIASDE